MESTTERKDEENPKESQPLGSFVNAGIEEEKALKIRVFPRRWLILCIFVLYASSSFVQWFQYSIISNVIEKYYSVGSWAVKMTSLIFMITYLPLAFPVSYLMDKLDLRKSALIGVIGTALGSWLKVLSVSPNLFALTFTGQTIIALSQLFIINVPPKLAAVWFGQTQVSTACSIAIFGSQFGIASGFFLSPMFVRTSEDLDMIGKDLYRMFLVIAIFTSAMCLAVLFFFQAKPPLPPSPAQALLEASPPQNESYLRSVRSLMAHRGFLFLATSNGINNGCFSAMSTQLNQIFLHYFPNGEQDPGTIGVTIVVSGMVGSVAFGFLMDLTKKYKQIAFWVYFLAAVTMIAYAFALTSSFKIDNVILASILGFFLLGYTPVGYELGSELTYPASEVTVATILNTMNMLAGIILVVIFDWTLEALGEFWANMAAAGSLFLGTFLTMMIKPDLKRQAAQKLDADCELYGLNTTTNKN